MKKSVIEASLLLVDDDPSVIQVLSRILSDYAPVRFATSGVDALRLAAEAPPDLILLDAQMDDMSGLQVCEALKADAALAEVPVIFVSSHQESELEVAVLKLGAVDFIRKPFNAAQVGARVATQLKLKRLADDLRRQSRIDGVTGLPNGEAARETLERELRRAAEAGQRVSVVRLDMDGSKAFEDVYGPRAFHAGLRALGQALARSLHRPGDLVARVVQDGFMLILPDTDAAAALATANRGLEAIEALDIPHQDSPVSRHVTCSAGVACSEDLHPADPAEPAQEGRDEALLRQALEALARAQQAGRAQAWLAVPAEAAGTDVDTDTAAP